MKNSNQYNNSATSENNTINTRAKLMPALNFTLVVVVVVVGSSSFLKIEAQ